MDEKVVGPRLEVGQPAPSLVLINGRHQPVELADWWPTGPTLLTFLRHFG